MWPEASLSIYHVLDMLRERERASIITSTNIQIERDNSLLTDHSFSASATSTWYIDSSALSHMTGAREMFSKISRACIDVEVVLGDETVVRDIRHGYITF